MWNLSSKALLVADVIFTLGGFPLPITAIQNTYIGGDRSGCGIQHPLGDLGLTIPHSLASSGIKRTYGVHLPASYDPKRAYPLIIGFHGSQSIGLFLEVDTRLDAPQYTGDKIIVYPDGIGGAWAGPSYAKTTVNQDLTFVHDILGAMRQGYCIDSARIYATGLSNGGGFVGTLACNDTVGGEFAAFAPVAGSFYTDVNGTGCTPARSPLPMLEFHGGADESVRYGGGQGEGGIEPPIMKWLGYWAKRNKCATPPIVKNSFKGDVHHYVWTCQGQDGVLQHYKTDDEKHDWPSPEPNFSQEAAGDKPTHLDASQLIIEFFNNYTRPAS